MKTGKEGFIMRVFKSRLLLLLLGLILVLTLFSCQNNDDRVATATENETPKNIIEFEVPEELIIKQIILRW